MLKLNIKDLKTRIGSTAEDIISSGLSLQKKGNRYVGQCPHGGHKKQDPAYEWKNDRFWCHDCRRGYDIIDYVRSSGDGWYNELCKLAGVEVKRKAWKKIAPASRKLAVAGSEYLKSRGIRESTIKDYIVTADDIYIYFNYLTSGDRDSRSLVFTKWRGITEKKFNATKDGTNILYGMHLLKAQTDLIICEGEIDCLSMYEIVVSIGGKDSFLCSSLPNGSGSLTTQLLENCRQWLNMFERIIIVPDQDQAGKKFVKDANKLLGDYNLLTLSLPCKDVNEYLLNPDYPNNSDIFSSIKELLPELSHTTFIENIKYEREINGVCSGFVGIDYNINGLKDGWVTLVTGRRGDGKTTFTRQILLSYAMQGIKSYMFCGESGQSKETQLLARLNAPTESIIRTTGQGGRPIYNITEETMTEFSNKYSGLIGLSDMEQI